VHARPSRCEGARRRCLELIATLPRLEAEQRAWPRDATLECEERGEARAAELRQLRAAIAERCAEGGAAGDLGSVLEAADEVTRCAACGGDQARHCARARELFVEMETALGRAGLR
jgi:hypothetical protein